MEITDRIIVVTGAGSGIGRQLVRAFSQKQAKHVVAVDINLKTAGETVSLYGGSAAQVDVGREAEIEQLIENVESSIGPIDLFCSNAGIAVGKGIAETDDATWEQMWRVNTMSHVWTARHLVPKMIRRGGGYLFSTASAAGLLAQIGSVTYSVTKHAAVALAEWLAITHGSDGIKVTVLCPQAVRTGMTTDPTGGVAGVDGMLEPEFVADTCVDAIEEERLFALPHPQVAEYVKRKATDPDRWIRGMQRLQERYTAGD